MRSILDSPISVLPDRFEYLMGLYAENYRRLTRLFVPQRLSYGTYRSGVGDELDVELTIQKRHPYTLELGLSYVFTDAVTGRPAPSAQLRMYMDARQVEALHCKPGQQLWHVLGPFPEARDIMQHRLQMNSFLDRWLAYLADQGHCQTTLKHSCQAELVNEA